MSGPNRRVMRMSALSYRSGPRSLAVGTAAISQELLYHVGGSVGYYTVNLNEDIGTLQCALVLD